mmetsp:Transcript_15624/g.31687  ORF Transcript_15624/g.31687 Transcript_15624/m.31687 type:complete len:220 (-) Transcript_15624:1032-1691(-)
MPCVGLIPFYHLSTRPVIGPSFLISTVSVLSFLFLQQAKNAPSPWGTEQGLSLLFFLFPPTTKHTQLDSLLQLVLGDFLISLSEQFLVEGFEVKRTLMGLWESVLAAEGATTSAVETVDSCLPQTESTRRGRTFLPSLRALRIRVSSLDAVPSCLCTLLTIHSQQPAPLLCRTLPLCPLGRGKDTPHGVGVKFPHGEITGGWLCHRQRQGVSALLASGR